MNDDEQERYFKSWLDSMYDKRIEDLHDKVIAYYRREFERELKDHN